MTHEFVDLFRPSRWLMERESLRGLLKRMEAATPDDIKAAMTLHADRPTPQAQLVGDVAVIPVSGPISYLDTWFSCYFGGATIKSLQAQFRAALADPAARAIVFRFNSPGGLVDMVPEFADEIFAARGQKPIVAVADLDVCSAAYFLASQCDQIYATRSSNVGAIGVYTEHDDISGMLEKAGIKITLIAYGDHKVDGNPYEPLPDDVKARILADVTEVGDEFTAAVMRGRGVSKKVVMDTFGQGLVFRGKKAIALGLADKLLTTEQVIAKLSKSKPASGARAAGMDSSAGTCPDCHGSGLQPERAMGDPQGQEICPTCSGSGKRSAAATSPVVHADGAAGCDTCAPECPCDTTDPEGCPDDCLTCSPTCPCLHPDPEEAHAAAPAPAVDAIAEEHAAILAALGE